MDGNAGLLEKLSRLGIHMLPKGAALAGGAIGGPAGAAIGQVAGSGLEQMLTPDQSPFSGSGFQVQEGGPMNIPEGSSRMGRTLGALAGGGADLGARAGIDTLGSAMGMGAQQKPAMEGISDEWVGLMGQLMKSVPRDELMRWLEQRSKSQIQGAV